MRIATDPARRVINGHIPGDAIVIIFITGAAGRRVFTGEPVDESLIGQGGGVYIADGSVIADGSILAGEGTVGLTGIHPWVTDSGSFEFGRFDQLSTVSAFTELQAPLIQIAISNAPNEFGRHRMSEILATDPMLNARVDVVYAFPKLSTADNLPIASFAIREIIEKEDTILLDCEGLAA